MICERHGRRHASSCKQLLVSWIRLNDYLWNKVEILELEQRQDGRKDLERNDWIHVWMWTGYANHMEGMHEKFYDATKSCVGVIKYYSENVRIWWRAWWKRGFRQEKLQLAWWGNCRRNGCPENAQRLWIEFIHANWILRMEGVQLVGRNQRNALV